MPSAPYLYSPGTSEASGKRFTALLSSGVLEPVPEGRSLRTGPVVPPKTRVGHPRRLQYPLPGQLLRGWRAGSARLQKACLDFSDTVLIGESRMRQQVEACRRALSVIEGGKGKAR
jgi:hypothetical protein